ncbi:hypothetical protein RHMOL_Rhmol02G0172800 [Rhododendron molle]|uniref:Uncharacterized protein n=1 Tax=Rhododendron molle TaxID=49168 RepID=A0ACC0PSL6_RHOML|nr:hypothetical protein RHMOL_Rhmol02G0172800 [Rhododendron molle]
MTLILLLNSGWGHHPKLSWTQQARPTNPHSYSPKFENKVLQAFQRLEASTRLLNSHTPSINKLETHMSQLGDTINTSEEGNFSSQPVSNFMDEYGLGSSQEKNIYHEEVNETMTLINEMVGETKSMDDNGDVGELMTNPMGLEIEECIVNGCFAGMKRVIRISASTGRLDDFCAPQDLWHFKHLLTLQLLIRTSNRPSYGNLLKGLQLFLLGRGAFTIATTSTLLTKALGVSKLVLGGRLPANQNAIVNLDPNLRNILELKSWPKFHNAVAAGLRLAPIQIRPVCARSGLKGLSHYVDRGTLEICLHLSVLSLSVYSWGSDDAKRTTSLVEISTVLQKTFLLSLQSVRLGKWLKIVRVCGPRYWPQVIELVLEDKPWWSTRDKIDPFNSGVLYIKRKVGSCSNVDDLVGCQSLLSRAMHKVLFYLCDHQLNISEAFVDYVVALRVLSSGFWFDKSESLYSKYQ